MKIKMKELGFHFNFHFDFHSYMPCFASKGKLLNQKGKQSEFGILIS